MPIILPCKQYLGFDDRKMMLIGIPLLSMAIPILLNFKVNTDHSYWGHLVPESAVYVIGFWMTFRYIIIAFHKAFPDIKEAKKRIKFSLLSIFLAAPLVKFLLEFVTDQIMNFCQLEEHAMPEYLQLLLNIYIPSGLIVALYEAMFYFTKYKESIVEKEKLEKIHIQTQLDNLRNQINPHFLFNSLNTLMNLIPSDPDIAMNYLSKLSKFYRYSVSAKEEMIVPLSKEIECAELYAELVEVRFRDGIHFTFPDNMDINQSVLPMTLQLLIENAVKHNIVSKSKPLNIKIEVDNAAGYVSVINNVQKKMEAISSTGMGLKNIQDRYSYFTKKEMICEKTEDYFKVSIPLLTQAI
jgi:two-component system, LytTR family, sensor kinase